MGDGGYLTVERTAVDDHIPPGLNRLSCGERSAVDYDATALFGHDVSTLFIEVILLDGDPCPIFGGICGQYVDVGYYQDPPSEVLYYGVSAQTVHDPARFFRTVPYHERTHVVDGLLSGGVYPFAIEIQCQHLCLIYRDGSVVRITGSPDVVI